VRVVITGATGSVGTSVVASLAEEPRVEEIVGVARRVRKMTVPKVRWLGADVVSSNLVRIFRDADAVVHLAWAIQPSHDQEELKRVNLLGSDRIFRAVARAEVPSLVYASSVGAYSAGPKDDRRVDEAWHVDGIPSSSYSRHKAAVERRLNAFEKEAPEVRVVRLRPGLIFKSGAASEVRRLFIGPFLPNVAVQRRLIPFVPRIDRLRFQAVHSNDVAEAYRQAIVRDVSGAFNVAAEPAIGPDELSSLLKARQLGMVDSSRARRELGWQPSRTALEAIEDLLSGLRRAAGRGTPPLEPKAGGRARLGELASGVGVRRG
jgi:UDP-glucose 4-epimerase